MQIEKTNTIRDIVTTNPQATGLFEELGIDYCCGGNRTLEEACSRAGLPLAEVLESIAAVETRSQTSGETSGMAVNWQQESLQALISRIVDHHHVYVRKELPRLKRLIDKICTAHGDARPEILQVRELLRQLDAELCGHMHKEEVILFPCIQQLETAAQEDASGLPQPVFGSVRNPIQMMVQEHDLAGLLIDRMQEALRDRSGCPTCQEFYRSLDLFEADLHQHIHLENNLLFPRAIELEKSSTPIKRLGECG